MDWNDIPQFIHGGEYASDVFLNRVSPWIAERAEDHGVEFDPDFQRGHVWNDAQRTKYVEYLLRGGVSQRTIYWNQKSIMDPIVLVDGKQRLTAVMKFFDGEMPIFDGQYFKDFTGNFRMLSYTLKFQINNLQTRRELLQWYLDLNDGGAVHSQDELDRVRGLLEKAA